MYEAIVSVFEELPSIINNNFIFFLYSLLVAGITFLSWKIFASADVIPGSHGLPLIGETFSFLSAFYGSKGVYTFVIPRRLRYGKYFKSRLFGKINIFGASTEGAKMILKNDIVMFRKGYFKSIVHAIGPRSLFCVPYDSHNRIRKLLADPFSMSSMSVFVKQFDKLVSDRLKELEKDGKSFVVLDFSEKITLDAMCGMLLSIEDPSLLKTIETDITYITRALISFPIMLPGTRYYRGVKARGRFVKMIEEMIDRRRSGKEYHDDFLQSMLQKDSYPAEERLDEAEIMDNIVTLIIAGQGTNAVSMMWSVKYLDENTLARDKLTEEALWMLRSKASGTLLSLEDLKKMSYGNKVVKETLRMKNPIAWFPRQALNDCVVDGLEIKKGWQYNVDVSGIHSDPTLHEDPFTFNPSRFDGTQKPYSYMPFGSGPRTCMGSDMARVMMLVFLQRLTSGYTWKVDDPDPSFRRKSILPILRSGYPITLTALNHGM